MLDEKIIKSLKEKYSFLHPLLFQRSVEKAKDAGELFDILESVPEKYPIVWDDDEKRWVNPNDLSLSETFIIEEE